MDERSFDTLESGVLYLIVVGLIYALVFAFGAGVVIWLPPIRNWWRRLLKFALFLLILLLIGDLFGFLWSVTICGRFYSSFDYDVGDFLPFMPITRSFIEVPFEGYTHQLNGISLNQLKMIWFIFAIGTWGTTFLLYRLILQRGRRRRLILEASKANA